MLVRILDMVGQDVTGKRVDIRSRNPDGSIMYDHLKGDPLASHVRTLKNVSFRMLRTHYYDPEKTRWLYWEWEHTGNPVDRQGTSASLADPKDWERYHLEVLSNA